MKIIHVHDIAFVGRTLVDALNKLENVKAIFFEREKYSSGLYVHLRNMRYFKRFLKKEKPDIVHIHYLPTSLYALFGKTKYVLHVHGSDIRGLSDNSKKYNIKQKIYRRFKKYILKNAQLVLYSTPDLKQDVEIVRKDSIFIPNPVKCNDFVKSKYKFKEKINILFFASLSDQKGADIALPALKELNEIYKDKINIVCIDFGKEKDKYNKDKFINYVNKVDHNDINMFINKFDIIIGQLKAGAIGVSELETMMQKIPLISNFKYDEFYSEKCPIISCENSKEVINSVNLLIKNQKLREEISQKQFEWVIRFHADYNVAQKLTEIYKTILEDSEV